MASYEREMQLEEYVLIKYTIEASKYMPETLTDPAEGGIEDCVFEIVITSDSILDHMAILGELAANYTDNNIKDACIREFENETEEDDI